MGSFFSCVEENDYHDEKMRNNSQFSPIYNQQVQKDKYSSALCKIICDDGSASGFFAKIQLKNRIIAGLVTNNHVLSKNNLLNGKTITIFLDATNEYKKIILRNNRFRFTCDMIDITFIEFQYSELPKEVVFLSTRPYSEEINFGFIVQHPNGKNCQIAKGAINYSKGFNILHQISTLEGSSGSPIISNGFVIGVHKGGDKKYNYGTNILYLINALDYFISHDITNLEQTIDFNPESHFYFSIMKIEGLINSGISKNLFLNNNNNNNNKTIIPLNFFQSNVSLYRTGWYLLTSSGLFFTEKLKDPFKNSDWIEIKLEDLFINPSLKLFNIMNK